MNKIFDSRKIAILVYLESADGKGLAGECAARAQGVYTCLNDLRFIEMVSWKGKLTRSTVVSLTPRGRSFLKKNYPNFVGSRAQEVILVAPFWGGKIIGVEPLYVFVLIPIGIRKGIDFQQIFDFGIKPAVENAGMKCEKANEIFHSKDIMDVIWECIRKARLLIADVTTRNPNVFYEIGIAHTLGKEVILITQSIRDVPFDLGHIKYIKYTSDLKGIHQLKTTLITMIKKIIEPVHD